MSLMQTARLNYCFRMPLLIGSGAILCLTILSGCTGTLSVSKDAEDAQAVYSENDEIDAQLRQEETTVGSTARRHALLVGCSDYPNLDAWVQLKGPANDVELLYRLLISRFGFDPKHDSMVRMIADSPADYQPTRANIEREFDRLARTVEKGEQVVILLGGHGSQQPDDDPNNPQDAEPDGLDEIFLPSDVKRWDGKLGRVQNAISDDEIRTWLSKLTEKGVFVWFIMDCCHSGTGVRGSGAEILRQVPAEVLVPASALKQAEKDAQFLPPDDSPSLSFQGEGTVVSIYAAQPHETTPERRFPENASSSESTFYGLLSYTLCEVLTNSPRNLTYTELTQTIQSRYLTAGRRWPTPMIEGTARDNLILGDESIAERSKIVLRKGISSSDEWKIEAGTLHGISEGSILAVHPSLGSNDSTNLSPLGHVSVLKSGLTSSFVIPCEYRDFPLTVDLPDFGRCEVVYTDLGDSKLQVAIDHLDADGNAAPNEWLAQAKEVLSATSSPLVAVVDEVESADWLVRWDSGSVALLPSSGVSRSETNEHHYAIPSLPTAAGWAKQATGDLEKIARATNLLRLASVISEPVEGSKLGFNIAVSDISNPGERAPLNWQAAGVTLRDGQRVEVQLDNSGKQSLDVTLLYVDSAYGITCLYPLGGESNRLAAGDSFKFELDIVSDTLGIESLISIVLLGSGQPSDLSLLEQPSLSEAQTRGVANAVLDTPLGQLCKTALYGIGNTRGVSRVASQPYAINILNWRIEP